MRREARWMERPRSGSTGGAETMGDGSETLGFVAPGRGREPSKGCNKKLTDKRIKAWSKFQIKSDRKNSEGEYHDPVRPWGAYRWAVCETCLQDGFDDKNNDGGKLIYRDGVVSLGFVSPISVVPLLSETLTFGHQAAFHVSPLL